MSTKPLGVRNVPMPAIVMVTPVPDVSVMFHDKRTVWLPPRLTELGVAENELMVGAAHALAVMVVWAVVVAPHPLVTVIV